MVEWLVLVIFLRPARKDFFVPKAKAIFGKGRAVYKEETCVRGSSFGGGNGGGGQLVVRHIRREIRIRISLLDNI